MLNFLFDINFRWTFLILHFCQYWIWWLLISNSTKLLSHKLAQYVRTHSLYDIMPHVMTICSIIGASVKKVLPGSGRVLGIQVRNNNITLPGEIFEDITESGNYNMLCLYNGPLPKIRYYC